MKKLTTLLLCLGLMLTYACQDDRYDTDQNRKGGVTAKLNLHTPDYTQVGTRATNESAIMDVTILQFINGKLAKKITMDNKYWGATVETAELDPMPASTFDPNGALLENNTENVMVFLANFKDGFSDYLSNLTADLATGTTYTAFLAANATLASAQALAELQSVPMTGFYYGGVTAGITNQINVSLTRALAKINFGLNTVNFQVDGKPATVTVKSIELRNVPLKVTFFESNRPSLPIGTQPGSWAGTPKLYPATGAAAGGTGLPRFDASSFTKLELAHNQSATPLTNFVAYIPENVRGSFTGITVNKDKHPDATVTPAIPAGNNVGWTYIYVDLHYVNDDGLDGDAQYCIYLGGDAAGDMNILSGVQYNVTTNLYGANDADTRITVQHGFDPRPDPTGNTTVEILKQANSYIINNTNLLNDDGKPLVLPLAQVRKGWQYIQTLVGADATLLSVPANANLVGDFDKMIEDNKWEIVTLWKTMQNATHVKGVQSTIIPATAGKYHAALSLEGGTNLALGHNYVIALRSTEEVNGIPAGTIWWTWHLWVTDYKPDLKDNTNAAQNGQVHTYISDAFKPGGRYFNKVMMDRNLGATGSVTGNTVIAPPTTVNDAVKWYGLMYQWGKKDPYTPSGDGTNTVAAATPIYNAGGTQIAYTAWNPLTDNLGNSLVISNIDHSGDGFPKVAVSSANRIIDVFRMPYVYFHSGKDNSWTTEHYNELWGASGNKTPFDPCPPGWRISVGGSTATNNPWAGFNGLGSGSTTNTGSLAAATPSVFQMYTSGSVGYSSANGTVGRYYDETATKAWYPSSGNRISTSGAFGNVGTSGLSWAASVTGGNGYYLEFGNTYVRPMYSASRAYGFPVRCISE